MSYTATYPKIFNAALIGSVAGIQSLNNNPSGTSQEDYDETCSKADTFAQEFDKQYTGSESDDDIALTKQLSMGYFLGSHATESQFVDGITAILAIMAKAKTYLQ